MTARAPLAVVHRYVAAKPAPWRTQIPHGLDEHVVASLPRRGCADGRSLSVRMGVSTSNGANAALFIGVEIDGERRRPIIVYFEELEAVERAIAAVRRQTNLERNGRATAKKERP